MATSSMMCGSMMSGASSTTENVLLNLPDIEKLGRDYPLFGAKIDGEGFKDLLNRVVGKDVWRTASMDQGKNLTDLALEASSDNNNVVMIEDESHLSRSQRKELFRRGFLDFKHGAGSKQISNEEAKGVERGDKGEAMQQKRPVSQALGDGPLLLEGLPQLNTVSAKNHSDGEVGSTASSMINMPRLPDLGKLAANYPDFADRFDIKAFGDLFSRVHGNVAGLGESTAVTGPDLVDREVAQVGQPGHTIQERLLDAPSGKMPYRKGTPPPRKDLNDDELLESPPIGETADMMHAAASRALHASDLDGQDSIRVLSMRNSSPATVTPPQEVVPTRTSTIRVTPVRVSPPRVVVPPARSPERTLPTRISPDRAMAVRNPILSAPNAHKASFADVLQGKSTVGRQQPRRGDSKRLTLAFTPPTMVDGVAEVHPPWDVARQGFGRWEHTLVGYFLGQKPYFPRVENFLRSIWADLVEVRATTNGFFKFRFASAAAMTAVLEGGPWLMQGKPLFLEVWRPGFSFAKAEHTEVPLWVKLWNVPSEFWTQAGLGIVASAVGKPLFAEGVTAAGDRIDFARVCVMKTLTEPFVETFNIRLPSEQGGSAGVVPVRVVYEWRPKKCPTCASWSHAALTCPNRPKENDERKPAARAETRQVRQKEPRPQVEWAQVGAKGKAVIVTERDEMTIHGEENRFEHVNGDDASNSIVGDRNPFQVLSILNDNAIILGPEENAAHPRVDR